MSVDVHLLGAEGRRLHLTKEGALPVILHNHPLTDEFVESYVFSEYFTNSNSNDMRVDGSATPVEFHIPAVADRDIFVSSISVLITDPGANLNEFGNLTALTNGLEFIYRSSSIGEIAIFSGIKTNLDFIRFCGETGAVGTGTDAWKSDIAGGGGEDSYMPRLNIQNTFGYQNGLHLRKGKNDELLFRVNDNLSVGMTTFNIIAFGQQIL